MSLCRLRLGVILSILILLDNQVVFASPAETATDKGKKDDEYEHSTANHRCGRVSEAQYELLLLDLLLLLFIICLFIIPGVLLFIGI